LESAKAAAQLLSSYPGKQLLILGDMGELGNEARRYHQEVGEFAKALALNTVLSLGVLSQSASDAFILNNDNNEKSQHFSQRSELMTHLITMLSQQLSQGQQDLAILVKGSRSSHMEYVVKDIMDWFEKMNKGQVNNEEVDNQDNQSKEGLA
ncbi:MAG: UDP-N-acetylmuramoyl-tripeptide--D-alanyl-D-alanine ligase, partial [Colwellia sp.]|nr:UDP-N-acetylmuramoyl-tripeptide--D-alanyl-D-alanine ligase [Colwellia sp.]